MTQVTMTTQADIDDKVQRLFNYIVKAQRSDNAAEVQEAEKNAVALGMELGSLVIGAFLRMADAQEKMASILEDEYGPATGRELFRGK